MRYLDRITNPDHLPLTWLAEHLLTADTFHAHVGYLDRAGVRLLEAPLVDLLDRGGQVHLVVDHRDGRPRHGDIVGLLELLAPYGDRATLRLASDPSPLHAKVFLLQEPDGTRRALVGSANFTAAGLARNHEACIVLEPDDTAALDDIARAAEAWRTAPASVPVDLGSVASMAALNNPNPTGTTEPVVDVLVDTLARIRDIAAGNTTPAGLPTGLQDLDCLLGGLRPGQLVIVAGRTSMGKSVFATNVLRANSTAGVPSLLMSFEMTRAEIMERILAAESRIPVVSFGRRGLNDREGDSIAQAARRVADWPLFINDSCTPSLRHIVTEVRRAVREDGVRLVVVDYLQQVQIDRRVESRQQEVAEISRALKRLALELQVPILAVSQLNRAPEQRVGRRPQLSDLRESGSLEIDSDVVILIHREDYYDRESPHAGEADLVVAKHRNGPTDTITVASQLHLARFVDMAI